VVDFHPDAHALRLSILLALADAPWTVKFLVSWDMPGEAYNYLNKLSYVSMTSR
jgi:hypothetical protein